MAQTLSLSLSPKLYQLGPLEIYQLHLFWGVRPPPNYEWQRDLSGWAIHDPATIELVFWGFHGISPFVGYLIPNPFLYK